MKSGNLLFLAVTLVLAGFAWVIQEVSRPPAKASPAVEQLRSMLAGDKPVLVEFYANWCGPCRIVGPEVQKLADEIRDQAEVVRFNVDEHRELSGKFGVQAIPCFISFKEGKEAGRQVGVISPREMRAMVGL